MLNPTPAQKSQKQNLIDVALISELVEYSTEQYNFQCMTWLLFLYQSLMNEGILEQRLGRYAELPSPSTRISKDVAIFSLVP